MREITVVRPTASWKVNTYAIVRWSGWRQTSFFRIQRAYLGRTELDSNTPFFRS
jgi:hypothetical protein